MTLVNPSFPQITIGDAAYIETGSGFSPQAVLTVRLSTAVQTPVTVNYTTLGITATAGVDYGTSGSPTEVTGVLTFTPGQTSQTITIPLLGDPAPDGLETFAVNLSSPTGGRGTLARPSATVTLLDTLPSGNPSVAISQSVTTFAENGVANTDTVTLRLSAASSTDTYITLALSGTAVFGRDYTSSSELASSPAVATVIIPAGQTSGSITLTGNDVAIPSSSETVSVTITQVNGSVIVVPPPTDTVTATLTPGTVASGSISGKVTSTASASLAGVIVYIDINGNNIFEPTAVGLLNADPFTTTAADGSYTIDGLAAGSYTVRQLNGSVDTGTPPVANSFVETSPANNTASVTLTEGQQQTGVNFTDTVGPMGVTLAPTSSSFTTTAREKPTRSTSISRPRRGRGASPSSSASPVGL